MEEQKHWFENNNHMDNQNNMRLSGKLCDVIIKVNNKEFQAHKVILASNLKYFESMFLNSFQESEQDAITMQDVRETDLEAFIMYAYTGKILLTDNNALDLFELANYLTEDGIKEACVNFLKIHLKKEDACIAYKMAKSAECFELKNVAKQLILLNFKDCSLTAEYLSLAFEGLKDILSYNIDFGQSEQILFEGIVRWLFHDAKSRKLHVNDVLDQIEIKKVKPDYLLQFFCKWIDDQLYGDTVKDIMIFYHLKSKKMLLTESSELSSMIVGYCNSNYHFQFFNLLEKKWKPPSVVANLDKRTIYGGAILKNAFYYTTYGSGDTGLDLRLFNPTSEQTMILTTDSRLLQHASICAGTNVLYFCGGIAHDGSESSQIVTYEPRKNLFETLPSMRTPRRDAASIFFQGCLFVVGGYESGIVYNMVEKYDPDTKTWTVAASMHVERYGHAVAVLDDKLYACGGFDENSVEVYDPVMNSWQLVASMNIPRANFFLVADGGKLLAIGGNNKTIEVYDPIKDRWQIDVEMSSGLEIAYPRGGLISTSCINDVIWNPLETSI